ncbi:carbohydrate ABC transporter permease [Phycicoccus sp. Soil803]|uniref:carbohydrate ABC transporter permease n=1 Tax=Phycicoccus sp. Soil803 TaxID=1736415 RepID=UPI000709B23C|nr:sugar ABC transporter permease [Phycicoccus sp. Soil803]KRF25983.1 sugar ABC transporter permease [Phycicoccus sp. Soil803]
MTMSTSVPAPAVPKPSRRQTRSTGQGNQGLQFGRWWWAAPGTGLLIATIYLATLSGAFFAFTDWAGIGSFHFIGLDNFREIFQRPELLSSLTNTLVFAIGFLVISNVLGLAFALALNRNLKSRYLLRTLLFMPVVLAPISVSYVWGFIFAFDGPLNQLFGSFGLESWQHEWLAEPLLAKGAILTVMIWQNIGFVMVVYLAGLATVPIEIEEAAALDGATRWQRLRHVVLPTIRPAVGIATTLTLIQGLRVFDQVMALTGGGPAGATETLATQVYKQTFSFGKFGFGAALALLLSVLILVFSVLQQFATRERS